MSVKEKIILIAVNIACVLLFAAGLTLDIVFRVGKTANENAAEFISALSVDTILSLVSIAAAIIIPLLEHGVPDKYNISREDYDKLTGSSNITLFHLLGFSIFFLFANGFLYAFDCRYSLLATFTASIIMFCAFLIPRIYSSVKAEEKLLNAIKKKFKVYRESNQNWRKDIFKESKRNKENGKLLCDIVLQILIEKGFDSTYELLSEDCKEDQDAKKEIFLFLFELLKRSIHDYAETQDMNNELTNKKLEQYIDCVSGCCFSNIPHHTFSDDECRSFCKEMSSILYNLDKILDLDKFSNHLANNLYEIIRKISFRIRWYKKDDNKRDVFFLSLLTSILTDDNIYNDPWILNALLYSSDSGAVFQRSVNQHYLTIVAFYVCLLLINNRFNSSISDNVISLLTNGYSSRIYRCINNDEMITSSNYFDVIALLKESCGFLNHQISKHHNISVHTKPKPLMYFATATDGLISTLLLFKYVDCPECIDDSLRLLSDDNLDNIIESIRRTDHNDFQAIQSIFNDCHLIRTDISSESFYKIRNYIISSKKRLEKCKEQCDSIGLACFINDMNEAVSKMDFFDYKMSERKNEKVFSRSSEITAKLCVPKNKVLELNNEKSSFLNPHYFVNSFANKFLLRETTNSISQYDKNVLDQIINFHPAYRSSPSFDKFAKSSHRGLTERIKKIEKIPQYNFDFIFGEDNTDDFFQKDAISFSVQIENSGNYIRNISREEANKYLKNNSKETQFSAEQISSIQNDYVLLHLKIKSELSLDLSKVLAYGIENSGFYLYLYTPLKEMIG